MDHVVGSIISSYSLVHFLSLTYQAGGLGKGR